MIRSRLLAGSILGLLLGLPAVAATPAADRQEPRLEAKGVVSLLRGPYLQRATPTSVLLCWRTNLPTTSRVVFGPSPQNLPQSVSVGGLRTEHRVELTGLLPATRYYYAVGDLSGPIFGDASTHFTTAAAVGSRQPLRLWVIGDSGRANADAARVYQGFRTWNGEHRVDGWLLLGDNAYNTGTDAEYQAALFDMYPEMLRQVPLWPVYGNHDGYSADAGTQTGPYFEIFEPPTAGQAGGLASGTEAYYSFDLGNLHVVVLDSFESSRAPAAAMATWLDADLAATNADWIVVAFHHPPYSKGSHDSDLEIELLEMRQNLLPIFEARGVDLVLSGHSHGYERSMLIDGHYGLAASFGPSMVVDGGDGQVVGDGVYLKSAGRVPHEGTVYVVAGVAASVSQGGTLDHPVMLVHFRKLGSLVLETASVSGEGGGEGLRLDVRLIGEDARELDHFTLAKGVDPCPETVLVPAGGIWKYRDDGADLGVSWRQEPYDDAGWPFGPAQLGYGDGDEATVIGYGPNAAAKYPTAYFRKSFTVADPSAVVGLTARILRDDGIALYLNGVPVVLDNLPSRTPIFETLATVAIAGAEESAFTSWRLSPSLLLPGTNVLAAEVHQASPGSTDLSFALELLGRVCSSPVKVLSEAPGAGSGQVVLGGFKR